MNVLGWVTLALGLLGALAAAAKAFSIQFTRLIVIATQVQEQVKLALVGIENLRIIDTDTATRLTQVEQRLADLERYTQLLTAESEHPFVIRYNHDKYSATARNPRAQNRKTESNES